MKNGYWKSYDLRRLIDTCDENTQKDLLARVEGLKKIYAEMSEVYQQNKGNTDIPLK